VRDVLLRLDGRVAHLQPALRPLLPPQPRGLASLAAPLRRLGPGGDRLVELALHSEDLLEVRGAFLALLTRCARRWHGRLERLEPRAHQLQLQLVRVQRGLGHLVVGRAARNDVGPGAVGAFVIAAVVARLGVLAAAAAPRHLAAAVQCAGQAGTADDAERTEDGVPLSSLDNVRRAGGIAEVLTEPCGIGLVDRRLQLPPRPLCVHWVIVVARLRRARRVRVERAALRKRLAAGHVVEADKIDVVAVVAEVVRLSERGRRRAARSQHGAETSRQS
jgi:hypothetical protein